MSKPHREYAELLPWYVNGTLGEHERERLREHLRQCLPCNAALREELKLGRAMQERDAIPIGQDQAFDSLLQRIDRRQPGPRRRFAVGPPLLGYGVAAIFGGLLVAVIIGQWRGPDPVPTGGEFSTLFRETGDTTDMIDVIFSESAGDAALQDVLEDIDGTVISGPTDLGRYTIKVNLDASSDSLEDILEALLEDPRIAFAGRAFSADPANDDESQ